MKKIYSVNNSKVVLGLFSGVKSRITSTMPALYQVITPMLFVAFGLFGVNESAWAYWTTDRNGNAQADNASIKGYVSNSGSTYYVLDDATERSISPNLLGNHVEYNYNVNGPAATLTFQTYRNKKTAVGNLHVAQRVLGGGWSDKYDKNPGTSYEGSGNIALDEKAVELSFYNDYGSYKRYFKNVKVTMASYFVLEKTSIAFGEADVNTANVSESFKIYWSNIAAKAITKTGDTDRFNVNITSVPSQAGYYGNTVLTITYKHDVAGSHSMTMTVNGQTITVTGTTNKLQPEVTWSPNDETFNVDDVLTATNNNGLTVTLSGNNTYVGCEGNSATMLAATTGKITITAHVAGNEIYADRDITKEITITNLEKQHISWDQDFSHLKTTDGTKSITLNATSDSGLRVTYELVGDKTGLSLTQSGSVWTLTYSATECKNTTIVAKQGGDATYAPASSVSKVVKVIDPTKVCDTNETLVNSTVTLKEQSATYNIDIPSTMTIQVSRTKTSWAIYIAGFKVELYSGRNGTGEKLHEYSYGAGDIDPSKTISLSNLNIAAKSVKLISDASNGYNVNSVTYTKQKKCTISPASLSFETYPNTTTSAKTFEVDYANYPISLECSNTKFAFSPAEFGDCDAYGTQTISVTYTAGADEGNDVGYLFIKDNTGTTLKTCTLNVSISKVSQSISSHTVKTAYKTTDRVELSAVANSKLTDFVYSASPEGVASFDGNVMTFNQSGTIAITVTQPGSDIYAATSTTVNNVVVSKVTPVIVNNPTAKAIEYRSKLENSTWTAAGLADVTYRGVEHIAVDGAFSWNDPYHVVMDAAGEHNYKATFTPSDGGMYNNVEYDQTITILRTALTLEMNNGAVKVAVDGIDEGKADSYLDLDDLIASQTHDIVNNNERAGAITYEVISENKANANIATGNIFSATAIGDYTIRATKAKTDYYNEVTDEFVVSVSKRANTMTISNTAFERFVDQEVTNVRDVQNSDAEVQTSSDFPTIAYYDVANNKIVIPNSESDYQMFGEQKIVTIKIWQDATDRFEASGEKTITLAVRKYVTTSNGEDYIIKVNETKTANYGFTNTSAPYPSSNLADDFYYTIDEPNFENEALNNGTELITYHPATNQITGHNAGTTKITFFQKETYKYTGATLMCNIAVEKRENQINNSWSNVWQKAMSENGAENISFTSTHGDYANYPIAIEQIYGEDVATLTGDASGASITTNTTKGYAIWHLSQAENYEYGSAEADVMVLVGVPAPPTCYVYQDNSEHKFSTGIGDAEGHFETQIAINSPVDKIWFNAKRQTAGVNKFVVQYSKDNGKGWTTLLSPSLETSYKSGGFSATFPAMHGTERITHVRFGAQTGATLSKWYKDVRISRKAYLNIQDAEKKKISKLPTMMCTIDESSSAEAKFYIDYSTCADEITIESSNPEHFTVSRETINVSEKHDNLTSNKEEITVTYHSTELGTHNAVITIRTSYQACALSVSGETTKRTPTLTWQEGYTNNPLTLPVGLTVNAINPAATTTSTALIKYESSDKNVVEITEEGYAFTVVGTGSAILTAIVPENDKWKSVSDTRLIQATEKVVQEIVWNQTFPRFMKPGDVIDLDAKVFLRNLSTGELTYSEERSQEITYSCPLNNGIVTISGTQMTIQNYGEVKVTASVSGNADYEAAAPVIVLINVRQPSAGCATPFVLNKEDVIDMYEVDVDFSNYTNLTTEEMISDEIDLDPKQGKPDKLSFRYYGEEYKIGPLIKIFGGFVKFEQRVNSQWLPVTNSRVETVKNEWKTKSDLQLDERADALRIIRESGATGHHKIKDIQVTRKQYLRATQKEINLGEVTLGQVTPVIVGFEYSDVKGDLTARTVNNTTDVTIKDNGAIDLECGSFGHYNLQVTFTPTQLGEWQGTIEVYDNIANLSITVQLSANVTANEEYIFNKEGNWNTNTNWTTNLVPNENVDITVAKNMTINSAASVKSITIEEGATVTVKKGVTLRIGNGVPKSRGTYGNLHVEDGGNVILNEGASLILNDMILDAKLGMTDEQTTTASSSGQITRESQITVNGDAYFRLALDPSGQNTLGWYDFVVPFPVDVIGGISIAEDTSAVMQFNVNYAVMAYDEAKHAQKGKHWNKFTGTMLPGRAYTITLDETKPWNTVVFKKKAGEAVTGDRSFTTEYSGLGAAKDNGWNGFGNGTLHHTKLNVAPGTLIQLYDHAHKCYQPREAKGYSIAVGLSFFMQFDGVEEVTLLSADDENTNFRAPKRAMNDVEKFRLALTAEDAINPADYIWISASEEATDDYVIGRDVLKMGSMNESTVARMWTTRAGMGLCSNEMPLVDNIAQCALGLYAPQARTYTIAVEEAPQDANLYLTYNDQVIWDLTLGAYTIDLAKGKTTGYGLRIEARAPQIATGVENAAVGSKSARKVMINNTLYVVTPEGEMYDITGKFVK